MNCLRPASFQISLQKGVNALKAKCDRASEVHSRGSLSPSVFPDFARHKTAVTWKGYIFFSPWQGWTLPRGGFESKFHIEPHCTPRRIRSIYLTCSLSTCFAEGEDPMESPIEGRNEKAVFSLLLSPFFSVTMMLQVPWGTSSPTGVSKGTINKEHFSCTPVVPSESPRGPNKDQHKCGILIARIKLNTYLKKKKKSCIIPNVPQCLAPQDL